MVNEYKLRDKPTFKKYLLVTIEVYGILTVSSFVASFFGGDLNLSLFFYILEITNPPSLVFVVCSPAVFSLFYTLWRAKNKPFKSVKKRRPK